MAYPGLAVELVEAAVRAAQARGVSKVATSPGGFAPAYLAAGSLKRLPKAWRIKRNGFLARHLAQLQRNEEPLYDTKGRPTRRHLALAVWAYSPDVRGLRRWLKQQGYLTHTGKNG